MLLSTTGADIKLRKWKVDNPKAQIFLVHGYAEHIGRYVHFAKELNEQGYDVIGYDQTGYGLSEGERAHVPRFDYYVWDLHNVINDQKNDELPTFLFGHSMGGLVVTSYCILYQPTLAGVITTAAALSVGQDTSKLLMKIAPIIGEIFPRLQTTKIGTQDISRDKKIVDEYENDPLIYHAGMKARLAAEMLAKIKKTSRLAHIFSQPLLIMHGTEDRLTNPLGSQNFYKNCSSDDKKLKIWRDCYHELLNEPEKEEIIKYIKKWIKSRVKSSEDE